MSLSNLKPITTSCDCESKFIEENWLALAFLYLIAASESFLMEELVLVP